MNDLLSVEEIDSLSERLEGAMKLANTTSAFQSYTTNVIKRLVALDNRMSCQGQHREIKIIDTLPMILDSPPLLDNPEFTFSEEPGVRRMATNSSAMITIAQNWSYDHILITSNNSVLSMPLTFFDRKMDPDVITLPGECAYSHAAAFHPCDRLMAFEKAGSIFLYDLEYESIIGKLTDVHETVITGLVFSCDGNSMISCSKDHRLVTYDLCASQSVFDIKSTCPVNTMAALSDSTVVAIGRENGTAQLFDTRDDRPVIEFEAHTGSISQVKFSPDSTMLATAGGDRVVHVLDIRAPDIHPLRSIKRHIGTPLCITFDNDRRIWSCTILGELQCWNCDDGKSVYRPKVTKQPIFDITYSPERNSIMFVSDPANFVEMDLAKVQWSEARTLGVAGL